MKISKRIIKWLKNTEPTTSFTIWSICLPKLIKSTMEHSLYRNNKLLNNNQAPYLLVTNNLLHFHKCFNQGCSSLERSNSLHLQEILCLPTLNSNSTIPMASKFSISSNNTTNMPTKISRTSLTRWASHIKRVSLTKWVNRSRSHNRSQFSRAQPNNRLTLPRMSSGQNTNKKPTSWKTRTKSNACSNFSS